CEGTHTSQRIGELFVAPLPAARRHSGGILLMEGAMPRMNVWGRSLPRIELDQRSREARLRLEQLERLFISLAAMRQRQARLRRVLYLFRARATFAIDVSPALTAAMQKSSQASIRSCVRQVQQIGHGERVRLNSAQE